MFLRSRIRLARAATAAAFSAFSTSVAASQPNVAIVGSADSAVFRSLCRRNVAGDSAAVTCFDVTPAAHRSANFGHASGASAQYSALRHVLRKADEPLTASSSEKPAVSLLDLHQGSYDAVVVAGDDPSTIISAAAAALLCARNGAGTIIPIGSSGLLRDYLRAFIAASSKGGLGGIFAARAALLGLDFADELKDERSWNRLAAKHEDELSWLHMPAAHTGGALLRGLSEHLSSLSEAQIAHVAFGPAAAVHAEAASPIEGPARPEVPPAIHVALPAAADVEVASALATLLQQVVVAPGAGSRSNSFTEAAAAAADAIGQGRVVIALSTDAKGQAAVRRAQWLQWGSDAVLRHAVRAVAASTAAAAASSAGKGTSANVGVQQPLSGSAAAATLLQGLAKDAAADDAAGFPSATVAHAEIRAAATRRAAAAAAANSAAASLARLAGSGGGGGSASAAASGGAVAAEDPFGLFPYPFVGSQGQGAGSGPSFSSPRDQALFSWLAVRAPNAAPLLTAASSASLAAEKASLPQQAKLQLFHAAVEVEAAAAAVAGTVPV